MTRPNPNPFRPNANKWPAAAQAAGTSQRSDATAELDEPTDQQAQDRWHEGQCPGCGEQLDCDPMPGDSLQQVSWECPCGTWINQRMRTTNIEWSRGTEPLRNVSVEAGLAVDPVAELLSILADIETVDLETFSDEQRYKMLLMVVRNAPALREQLLDAFPEIGSPNRPIDKQVEAPENKLSVEQAASISGVSPAAMILGDLERQRA